MAVLLTLPARNINGTFTSPSVNLPVRVTPGRYRLVIVWEDAGEVIDPTKSWHVNWEWQNPRGEWIVGGGCGQIGDPLLVQTEFSAASWHVRDGEVVDESWGRPARLVVQAPAPEYPTTSGGVRLSGRIEDY